MKKNLKGLFTNLVLSERNLLLQKSKLKLRELEKENARVIKERIALS